MPSLRIIRRDQPRRLLLFAGFCRESLKDNALQDGEHVARPCWTRLLPLFDPKKFRYVSFTVYPFLLHSDSPWLTPLRLALYFGERDKDIDRLFYISVHRKNLSLFTESLYEFIERGTLPAICNNPYGTSATSLGDYPPSDLRMGPILRGAPQECNNAGAGSTAPCVNAGGHRPDS